MTSLLQCQWCHYAALTVEQAAEHEKDGHDGTASPNSWGLILDV